MSRHCLFISQNTEHLDPDLGSYLNMLVFQFCLYRKTLNTSILTRNHVMQRLAPGFPVLPISENPEQLDPDLGSDLNMLVFRCCLCSKIRNTATLTRNHVMPRLACGVPVLSVSQKPEHPDPDLESDLNMLVFRFSLFAKPVRPRP